MRSANANVPLPQANGRRCGRRRHVGCGVILMEVILALALFMAAGAVVFGALSASANAVNDLRLQAQAADLAVTKLSEIQMGLLEAIDDGPNAFTEEGLEEWTWQIVTASMEDEPFAAAELKQVEIIIAHKPSNTVRCLMRLFRGHDLNEEIPSAKASKLEDSEP